MNVDEGKIQTYMDSTLNINTHTVYILDVSKNSFLAYEGSVSTNIYIHRNTDNEVGKGSLFIYIYLNNGLRSDVKVAIIYIRSNGVVEGVTDGNSWISRKESLYKAKIIRLNITNNKDFYVILREGKDITFLRHVELKTRRRKEKIIWDSGGIHILDIPIHGLDIR